MAIAVAVHGSTEGVQKTESARVLEILSTCVQSESRGAPSGLLGAHGPPLATTVQGTESGNK